MKSSACPGQLPQRQSVARGSVKPVGSAAPLASRSAARHSRIASGDQQAVRMVTRPRFDWQRITVVKVYLCGSLEALPHGLEAAALSPGARAACRVSVHPLLLQWSAEDVVEGGRARGGGQLLFLGEHELDRGRRDLGREIGREVDRLCIEAEPRLLLRGPRAGEQLLHEQREHRTPLQHGSGQHRVAHDLSHVAIVPYTQPARERPKRELSRPRCIYIGSWCPGLDVAAPRPP